MVFLNKFRSCPKYKFNIYCIKPFLVQIEFVFLFYKLRVKEKTTTVMELSKPLMIDIVHKCYLIGKTTHSLGGDDVG